MHKKQFIVSSVACGKLNTYEILKLLIILLYLSSFSVFSSTVVHDSTDFFLPSTAYRDKTIYDIWGVGMDGRVYNWNGVSWDEPNPAARLDQISVGKDGGIKGLGYNGRVFRWNGQSWDEPNPSAHLYQISNVSESDAFGVGRGAIKSDALLVLHQAACCLTPCQ